MRGIGSCAAMSSSYATANSWSGAPSSTWIQQLHVGRLGADLGHAVAELAVEEQGLGVGVVDQVRELVLEVAVVHVDRHAAHLERRVHAFAVLVAVVEVRRDLRVRSEPAAASSAAARRAARSSNWRQRDPPVALDQRDPVGNRVAHRLPHVREVPGHGHSSVSTSLVGCQVWQSPSGSHRPVRTLAIRGGESSGRPAADPAAGRLPRGRAAAVGRARPGRAPPHARRCPAPARCAHRPASSAVSLVPGSVPAAVLVPLVEIDGETHVLFIKRPETMSTHKGEIAFPGGKIDPARRRRHPCRRRCARRGRRSGSIRPRSRSSPV